MEDDYNTESQLDDDADNPYSEYQLECFYNEKCANSIICRISEHLYANELLTVEPKVVLDEKYFFEELYCIGFICFKEVPDQISLSEIHRVKIEDGNLVISFVYISMMISDAEIEDYLCQKILHTRKAFLRFIDSHEVKYIKEQKLGVRITAFAGIGGEGYHQREATVFTADDLNNLGPI